MVEHCREGSKHSSVPVDSAARPHSTSAVGQRKQCSASVRSHFGAVFKQFVVELSGSPSNSTELPSSGEGRTVIAPAVVSWGPSGYG